MSQLDIRGKIFLTCCILALISASVIGAVYSKMSEINDLRGQVTEQTAHVESLNQLKDNVKTFEIYMRRYLLSGNAAEATTFEELQTDLVPQVNSLKEKFSDNPAVVERLDAILANVGKWMEEIAIDEMMAGKMIHADMMEYSEFKDTFSAGKGAAIMDVIFNDVKQATELVDTTRAELQQKLSKESALATQVVLWGMLFNLLVTIALLLPLAQRIYSQVKTRLMTLLTTRQNLGEASGTLASSGSELAQGSAQLKSLMSDTLSAVDELLNNLGKAASTQREVHNKAANTGKVAGTGIQLSTEMVGVIKGISYENDTLTKDIEAETEEIKKVTSMIEDISQSTKTIDEIVFQTRLLSFNAAVEAARAGEHGKGFGILADEIGKLAQVSGERSREINDIVENSVKHTQTALEHLVAKVDNLRKRSAQMFERGLDSAQSTEECLKSIDEQARSMIQAFEEFDRISANQQMEVSAIKKNAADVMAAAVSNEERSRVVNEISANLRDYNNGLAAASEEIRVAITGAKKRS